MVFGLLFQPYLEPLLTNASFSANSQGAQGAYDSAPKSQLENEFGTSNEDEVIKAILEKGSVQESSVSHPPPPSLSLP